MPPEDRSVADRGEVGKTLLGLGTALPRLLAVSCASPSSLQLPLLSVLCVSPVLGFAPLSVQTSSYYLFTWQKHLIPKGGGGEGQH